MILDVIRHGKTATNVVGRFNIEDEPLLPEEFEALRAVPFQSDQYRRVISSPLRRCIQTAEALRAPVHDTDPRLSERNFGVFSGLTLTECLAGHREAFEAFSRFDSDFVIPGGESRAQHFERIAAWLAETCRPSDDPILLITHGGTLDFLYRLARGLSLHGGDRIHAGQNAAISSFRVQWPDIELGSFSVPLLGRHMR